MILEIPNESHIQNPDSSIIEQKLRNLLTVECDPFLILIKSKVNNDYMQAITDGLYTFHVEYRDGLAKKHCEVDNLSVEDAILLFQDYLNLGSSWQEHVSWKDVSHFYDWDEFEAMHTQSAVELFPIIPLGVIYLLKTGSFYKIGEAENFEQRLEYIKIQLPYPVEVMHTIETDDIHGIKDYWHKRFAEKRAHGEWFLLTESDVAVFKSRSRM